MPRFHWWRRDSAAPDPDSEPEPDSDPPALPLAFGQPAPPAQPLQLGDELLLPPLPPLPPVRCIICGAVVPDHLDAFCVAHDAVGDVAFAVYVGELSEWPGQCVNDRVMMTTHPLTLGLRVMPWQATVTAILSREGVWLDDWGGSSD